jgi:hypothetical protein
MTYDYLPIVFMVIAIVTGVLGVGYVALYRLDKAVDAEDR